MTWMQDVYQDLEEDDLELMSWYQQDLAILVRLKNRFVGTDFFYDLMDCIVYSEYSIGQMEGLIAETREKRRRLAGV